MSAHPPHLTVVEDIPIGPGVILDSRGAEFAKSSRDDGIQSPSQRSSLCENGDSYTSVDANATAVDSSTHKLQLLISQNLFLKDDLQEGDHVTLDQDLRSDQQATRPPGKHPVASLGRGRGQLKQTFQHYLSKRGGQSSGIGRAALNKGHEQEAWQKGETSERQIAVNLSADQMVSSGDKQEKATPALVPTLVPSFDSKSGSPCHGTESEIELDPKPKSQAESVMETEPQTAMPPSFLFQLLESCHIGGMCGTSEENIASLQKKIGDLEVSKRKALLLVHALNIAITPVFLYPGRLPCAKLGTKLVGGVNTQSCS